MLESTQQSRVAFERARTYRKPRLFGKSEAIGRFCRDSAIGVHSILVLGARHHGQFERELMLERQREGIAKAKGEGKYKGRAPTARAKAADVRRLADEGMTREAIAAKLNIGVASVYRALRAA